jgi:hypothetical protein
MQQQGGWFSRNWAWFVPVVILVPTCLCCLPCGGYFYFVFTQGGGFALYGISMQQAITDPRVTDRLGQPIEPVSMMPTVNSSSMEGGSVSGDVEYDLKGPNGQAHVHAVGSVMGQSANYDTFTVTFDDGTVIDLTVPDDGGDMMIPMPDLPPIPDAPSPF